MLQLFFKSNGGYFSLTPAGYALFIGAIVIILLVSSFIRSRVAETGKGSEHKTRMRITTKQLVFCAVAMALGFVASYLKLFQMPLGGSVTLFSMLFITLIGYWYGLRVGLLTAFAYGILQFLQDGTYILSPLQVCFDYIFAFTALGLSGLFCNQKHGLIKGYLFSIFVRGIFNSLAGYFFWSSSMPADFPYPALYPALYNYSFILAEGVLTVVVLVLPPVTNAMKFVKKLALEEPAYRAAAVSSSRD